MTAKRLAIAWVILFITFYIILSSTGCRTVAPSTSRTAVSSCPEPEVIVPAGLGLSEVDVEHVGYARKGCEKHFGAGACLIKFIRLEGERNYHAICRRMQSR